MLLLRSHPARPGHDDGGGDRTLDQFAQRPDRHRAGHRDHGVSQAEQSEPDPDDQASHGDHGRRPEPAGQPGRRKLQCHDQGRVQLAATLEGAPEAGLVSV
jgi:hypothetical protein